MSEVSIFKITVLLIFIWSIPSILAYFATKSEPHPEDIIIAGVIPGINLIVFIAAIVFILIRIIKSPRCALGHNFKETMEHEQPRFTRGTHLSKLLPKSCLKSPRKLYRVPMAGFDKYHCTVCQQKLVIKWSAF